MNEIDCKIVLEEYLLLHEAPTPVPGGALTHGPCQGTSLGVNLGASGPGLYFLHLGSILSPTALSAQVPNARTHIPTAHCTP